VVKNLVWGIIFLKQVYDMDWGMTTDRAFLGFYDIIWIVIIFVNDSRSILEQFAVSTTIFASSVW
jgi:hypothetical protein